MTQSKNPYKIVNFRGLLERIKYSFYHTMKSLRRMKIHEKKTPKENIFCNYNDLIKSKDWNFLVKHFYSIELENELDNT